MLWAVRVFLSDQPTLHLVSRNEGNPFSADSAFNVTPTRRADVIRSRSILGSGTRLGVEEPTIMEWLAR